MSEWGEGLSSMPLTSSCMPGAVLQCKEYRRRYLEPELCLLFFNSRRNARTASRKCREKRLGQHTHGMAPMQTFAESCVSSRAGSSTIQSRSAATAPFLWMQPSSRNTKQSAAQAIKLMKGARPVPLYNKRSFILTARVHFFWRRAFISFGGARSFLLAAHDIQINDKSRA